MASDRDMPAASNREAPVLPRRRVARWPIRHEPRPALHTKREGTHPAPTDGDSGAIAGPVAVGPPVMFLAAVAHEFERGGGFSLTSFPLACLGRVSGEHAARHGISGIEAVVLDDGD